MGIKDINAAELEEPEGDVIGIVSFNGHRWVKGNVEFQVVWTDNDITWEPRSIADLLQLGKRKFLINKSLSASN